MKRERIVPFEGVVFIVVAASLWGGLGPVAKAAFSEGLSPLETAFWRACLGGAFFVLHRVLHRTRLRFGTRGNDAVGQRSAADAWIRLRDLPLVVVFAVVSVSLFYGSYQAAVHFGGAARASVLLYTAPAWVTVLAALFLKERIEVTTIVGVTLVVAGVALISFGGVAEGVRSPDGARSPATGSPTARTSALVLSSADAADLKPTPTPMPTGPFSAGGWDVSSTTLGIVFGLTAGFTYALYYILGRNLLGRYPSTVVFSYVLLIGAAGLAPFVSFRAPSLRAWGALLFLGFAATYLAYMAYARGLLLLRSSQASIIATIEPVVAAVLAYVWWDERLGVAGSAGAALVIAGVITQTVRHRVTGGAVSHPAP